MKGIRFQAVSGNDFVDAVYSLTVAVLEDAGQKNAEAAASLAQLRSSKGFQVAIEGDMHYLVADGVDIKARFREADVKELVARAVQERAKNPRRPN